jgi:hypothetical protein
MLKDERRLTVCHAEAQTVISPASHHGGTSSSKGQVMWVMSKSKSHYN